MSPINKISIKPRLSTHLRLSELRGAPESLKCVQCAVNKTSAVNELTVSFKMAMHGSSSSFQSSPHLSHLMTLSICLQDKGGPRHTARVSRGWCQSVFSIEGARETLYGSV